MTSGITKDTFKAMDIPSKLDVLFDYVHSMQENVPIRCEKRAENCGKRFDAIERKHKIWGLVNSTLVSTFSFIGGFAAVWAAIKLKMFGGH
jgi:hypothetical protein